MSKMALAYRQDINDYRCAKFNSCYIKLYDGTRPANANTALSGNTLLATLRGNATAFGATDASGIATANAVTAESNAPASGTTTFARVFASDGTTVLGDYSVGTSGAEINLTTLSVVATGTVSCTSWTMTYGIGS